MNPEALHDAVSLLPEDMLTQVDQLRQKKRVPWKSIAALVACLCLAVGLWLFFPGDMVAMDSAANGAGAPEFEEPMEGSCHSTSTKGIMVHVYSVEADHIQISEKPPEELVSENICIQTALVTLTFENLEQVPQLQAGQQIHIYFEPEQFDDKSNTVSPYKIEIIEE